MFSIRVDAYPGDGSRKLLRNITSNLRGVNSIRRFASMFRMERSLDLKQAKFLQKTSMVTRQHGVTLQNTFVCCPSLQVRPEYHEDVGSSFLPPNHTTTHP
jgi:hypothetical protein